MALKKLLIIGFISLSNLFLVAQDKVCFSSSSEAGDLLMELNSIDKCIVEKQQSTTTNENVLPTRNRYVRTRPNNYMSEIRKKISAINTENEAPVKKATPAFVYLKKVTQEPVLLIADPNANYEGDLAEVLNNYINDHLIYTSALKNEGLEGTVWTSFVIDVNGTVKNIVTSGPIGGKLLEEAATKLIETLPKFEPGELHGEKVNVKHLMSINFSLDK